MSSSLLMPPPTLACATSFPRSNRPREIIARGRGSTRSRPPHRRPRPLRRQFRALSPEAELVEPVLVDPEIVRELVQDGDPDLVLELGRILEGLDQRHPVDRHLRGQVRLLLEQSEEVRLLGVLLLDDDGDILQRGGEIRRQRVERAANVLVEGGRQMPSARRSWRRVTRNLMVSKPKMNPPTCAKNATPPPASGWTI